MNIRPAKPADLEAIREIYNEAVANTTATFDTEPRSSESQKRWWTAHGPKHPVIVAEDGGEVVGWASLSIWSDRCAYEDTTENSVYVIPSRQKHGIGRKLLDAILIAGQKAGVHTVLARIAEENTGSIHLHENCGFKTIGIMKEVGFKFGRRIDVRMMQKML